MPQNMSWIPLLAAAVVGSLLTAGGMTMLADEAEPVNVLSVAEEHPSTTYFTEQNPVEQVQATKVSAEALRENSFYTYCGNHTPVKRYWKVTYLVPGGTDLVAWVDPEAAAVTCLNQAVLNPDETERIGIRKNTSSLTVGHGTLIEEDIYTYAVNTNATYYTVVHPVEKPDWSQFQIDPRRRTFEPIGRDPIQVNLQMDPGNVVLQKPERVPPGTTYLPQEEGNGFIEARTVTWQVRTPRKNPSTGEGPTGDFVFRFNVSVQRFQGDVLRTVEHRVLNYTVHIPPG